MLNVGRRQLSVQTVVHKFEQDNYISAISFWEIELSDRIMQHMPEGTPSHVTTARLCLIASISDNTNCSAISISNIGRKV